MSKEKQIEEIAKAIASVPPIKFPVGSRMQGRTIFALNKVAESIYNAGYRKQSEGIANNATTTGEWISVDERLPDGYGDFLVVVKRKLLRSTEWERCVGMATYNVSEITSVNGWDIENEDGWEYIVTHWMPLPEPPKMKEGAE